MKTLLILFTALCLPAHAKEKPRNPSSQHGAAHVIQMDPDFPIEGLADQGVQLHPLSEVGQHGEALPPSVQRRFFLEAGLLPLVGEWGGLEQDRFALRCMHQSAAEVHGRYDGLIPIENIRRFQALAQKHRKAGKK